RAPLKSQEDLNRFCRVVGGHPYLVRRGLQELAGGKTTLAAFETEASRDESFYGDHLKRILFVLGRDAKLTDAMRCLLENKPCADSTTLERLRSAGLVVGHIPEGARPRCRLYASYLR